MTVNKPISKEMVTKLNEVCTTLESIISRYENEFADYGWDNFTETLVNISAQVYMMRVMLENAQVKETYYR